MEKTKRARCALAFSTLWTHAPVRRCFKLLTSLEFIGSVHQKLYWSDKLQSGPVFCYQLCCISTRKQPCFLLLVRLPYCMKLFQIQTHMPPMQYAMSCSISPLQSSNHHRETSASDCAWEEWRVQTSKALQTLVLSSDGLPLFSCYSAVHIVIDEKAANSSDPSLKLALQNIRKTNIEEINQGLYEQESHLPSLHLWLAGLPTWTQNCIWSRCNESNSHEQKEFKNGFKPNVGPTNHWYTEHEPWIVQYSGESQNFLTCLPAFLSLGDQTYDPGHTGGELKTCPTFTRRKIYCFGFEPSSSGFRSYIERT